jgi:hypothetical protein
MCALTAGFHQLLKLALLSNHRASMSGVRGGSVAM